MDGRSVGVARPRELRALSRLSQVLPLRAHLLSAPLRARTVHEMVHLDWQVGWRAQELSALSELLLRASFGCKGIP